MQVVYTLFQGYWLWKKQRVLGFIDGSRLDIHNDVVTSTVFTTIGVFLFVILVVGICGCDSQTKKNNRVGAPKHSEMLVQ